MYSPYTAWSADISALEVWRNTLTQPHTIFPQDMRTILVLAKVTEGHSPQPTPVARTVRPSARRCQEFPTAPLACLALNRQ